MNRQQKRQQSRDMEWINSLSPSKTVLLNEYAKELSKRDIQVLGNAYERVLRVKLNMMLENELETEKVLEEIIDGITEEGKIIQKNLKEGMVYDMEIEKYKDSIITEYLKAKGKGTKEKVIIEDLAFNHNTLTKTAIKNIIIEYKRDNVKDIDSALEYIFPKEDVDQVESKEVVEEKLTKTGTTSKEKIEPKKEVKNETKKNNIKITSGTLKGEYDRYTVEDGIVSLNNIKISTVEDVENYRSKLIIEAEKRVNELIEVIRMVM